MVNPFLVFKSLQTGTNFKSWQYTHVLSRDRTVFCIDMELDLWRIELCLVLKYWSIQAVWVTTCGPVYRMCTMICQYIILSRNVFILFALFSIYFKIKILLHFPKKTLSLLYNSTLWTWEDGVTKVYLGYLYLPVLFIDVKQNH